MSAAPATARSPGADPGPPDPGEKPPVARRPREPASQELDSTRPSRTRRRRRAAPFLVCRAC